MNVESFLQNLKVSLDAVSSADELLESIATGVAGFFSVRDHEVGVFAVNHKKYEIAFLWPRGMTTGHIPLKAMNSLVAKTANELVTTLDNSFAKSRHLFIFEFMLAEKSDRIPIQKIMSVPVIANGEAKAVIQVVRKGAAIADAGEDFTDDDLSALVKIAELLSDYSLQGA